MLYLPEEIIEYILENEEVTFQDAIRLSLTCKRLYKIVNNNNKLWATKFYQRWPFLKEIYQENDRLQEHVLNWQEEFASSLTTRRKLYSQLSLMSSKYYRKHDLCDSDFKDFNSMFCPENGAHIRAYYFLVDELVSYINRPAASCNLTYRYYALKVVRYLRQNYLNNEWQKFISLPARQQILERGAAIVAQWCQPERHVLYSYISSLLDNIAEQTKEVLRMAQPTHSIFTTPRQQFNIWRNNNIDDNQWPLLETKQVLDALCKVLFQKLGFYGNGDMYYSSENSFIDRVLECKRGIPTTLTIIFESVARRLGVRCEPVSLPSHFLLRWKEKYLTSDAIHAEHFYIDVFNGGQFLTKKNCPRISETLKDLIENYNAQKVATAVEVVTKMANNLEVATRQQTHLNGGAPRLRSALELRHMVQPYDTNTISALGRFYMMHKMDNTELMQILKNVEQDLELASREQAKLVLQRLQSYQELLRAEEDHFEQKKRVTEVKYAIGMIMWHTTNGYLCVIAGWFFRNRPMPRSERIFYVETDDLEGLVGTDNVGRLFYKVFADDGSTCFATQANLTMATIPRWIDHYEIGRYFCQFNGTHYVPIEERAREYPEDAEIREKLLQIYPKNNDN